ncbi:MAG: type I restriction-modification system subunit M N-terminal domain-containing protein [Bacteroidales bacterium]|nr:type I restriction-modification system subunit M N-terminal domain-containing protein [Bacteroidales bacterium]
MEPSEYKYVYYLIFLKYANDCFEASRKRTERRSALGWLRSIAY